MILNYLTVLSYVFTVLFTLMGGLCMFMLVFVPTSRLKETYYWDCDDFLMAVIVSIVGLFSFAYILMGLIYR